MCKKIIFLRVSLTDVNGKERQEIEQQIKPITDKYKINPEECIIIKDKGSAYDMSKFKRRKGFIEILDQIIGEDKIKDLFFGDIEKKDLEIYVFDYNRIFRNTTYGILFGAITNLYNVKIFTVNQNADLIINESDTSTEKSISYLKMALYSQQAEIYSENTSNNTKKAFEVKGGLTYSKKGTLLGNWFRDLNNNRVKLSKNKAISLHNRLINLIDYYETKTKIMHYYSLIVKQIEKEFKITISKSYITSIKKKEATRL